MQMIIFVRQGHGIQDPLSAGRGRQNGPRKMNRKMSSFGDLNETREGVEGLRGSRRLPSEIKESPEMIGAPLLLSRGPLAVYGGSREARA
jgi:hypothetical protein